MRRDAVRGLDLPAWRLAVVWLAARPELFAAGSAVVIWSGIFPVTRAAVAAVDPILIGGLRTIIAALLVAPAFALRRPRTPDDAVGWGLLAAGAVGNYVAFPVLGSLGLAKTSAARASLIFASAPVFTALLGAGVLREAVSRRRGLGIGAALAGVAVLIGPGAAAGDWRGDVLVLLATLGASVSYVTGAAVGRKIGAGPVVGYSSLIGALLLAPILLIFSSHAAAMTPGAWVAVLYLGLLGTLLANALWIWALARGSVVGVGSLQFLQPVLTVAIAAVFLKERLDWTAALSGVTILAGVLATQEARLDHPRRRPSVLRISRCD